MNTEGRRKSANIVDKRAETRNAYQRFMRLKKMREKMRDRTPDRAWNEMADRMEKERNVYVPEAFDMDDRMYEDMEKSMWNEKHEKENVTQEQDNTKVKLKKHNWME